MSEAPPDPAELACVAATLRMAARAVTRRYDDALRPSGLRTTQLSMLSRLREDGPLTVTALASRLALERTTVTRELDTLARRGLVSLATGDDRRTRVAAITAEGRAAMRVAVPLWREAQAATDELLGRERVERLLADLRVAVRRSSERLVRTSSLPLLRAAVRGPDGLRRARLAGQLPAALGGDLRQRPRRGPRSWSRQGS